MASHHDWVDEQVAKHDAEKPFAPENGQPLKFNVGDKVIWTHPEDENTTRHVTVISLYQPKAPCAQYAQGKRYLIDWDSPWYPVAESTLQPA